MKTFPVGLSTDSLRQAAEREGWEVLGAVNNVVFAQRPCGTLVLVTAGKCGPQATTK